MPKTRAELVAAIASMEKHNPHPTDPAWIVRLAQLRAELAHLPHGVTE